MKNTLTAEAQRTQRKEIKKRANTDLMNLRKKRTSKKPMVLIDS
jgi:hypothetical protein